ncbi:DUF1992 domain-containing protein [Microbacterium betulae]|uniref:DUF1992 domain-containing protein n=1 Tax=Microbacterium betulae TaxID=2981139 RepID=A0AA97I6A9_9MICO|nr:DUF1992 domain-containing protein [Microbacterium sp. AB]WOF24631.1 DUF1992 domain-containing protein [Microbacterium sp. AB]
MGRQEPGPAEDPRVAASRYRIDRIREDVDDGAPDEPTGDAGSSTATDRTAYVETVIQQAIRRGEFDDLPGAGRPIPGLGTTHDPDWWIRRKIQREGLTGIGPPALQLRVEHAGLQERLDALTRESDVREYLEDFNGRVRHARLQLLGGPPVVTPTCDVDAETAGWAARRAERLARMAAQVERPAPRRRSRLRRSRGGRGLP